MPLEQQVEQIQEQAVAKEVQEQRNAVTGEASVQHDVPAMASTEKMKSKLEAKRRENVGRPKKASQPKAPRSPGNPSHLHCGSGFTPQSAVHFSRGRHPLKGRYLRSAEQLCGCLGNN